MDIIKYYTDYVDKVQERFPELDEKTIKSILYYGFKKLAAAHLIGLDTLHKTHYYTAYFGKLFLDDNVYHLYWRLKKKKRLRYLYRRKKIQFNGKYYFGLTKKQYEYYSEQKSPIKHFPYVYAYKVKDEVFVDNGRYYFFEWDVDEDVGFVNYKENVKTMTAKLFAYKDDNNNLIYLDNDKRRKNRNI